MFYRLALTFGLLVLPLASAEASYQQNYRLPSSSSSSVPASPDADETMQTEKTQEVIHRKNDADATSNDADDTVTGPWSEIAEGDATITRAAFTAQLVRSLYTQGQIDSCFRTIAPTLPPRFTLVFTDVTVNDLYAKEVCIAMRDGLVRGLGDGSFLPNHTITFAESAKILSRTFVLAPYADADIKSPWYLQHVRALIVRNAIPITITRLNQKITADEAKEMFDRLKNGITWRPAQTMEVLFPLTVVRKPAAVTPVPVGIPASPTSSSKTIVSPQSSSKNIPASSASSHMPASAGSSKESFWDLF